MTITEEEAVVLIGMADVCYNEGIGPDGMHEMLDKVTEHFPHLEERCHWIYKRNKADQAKEEKKND